MNSVPRSSGFHRPIGFCLIAVCALGLTAVAWAADEPAMRTWTDSTGKFKIRAKFLSESGGKVTLEKDDGSEMEIELKKLSTADQKYVKDLSDSDNPFKTTDKDPFKKKSSSGSSKAPASTKSAGAAGKAPEAVTPNWASARAIEATPKSNEWNIALPPASISSAKLSTKPISLPQRVSVHERVKRVALNPAGTRAVLVHNLADPRPDGQTRLVLCDLEKGKTIGSGSTSGQWSVLDVNEDATRLLVCRDEFGPGKQDKLEVWSLTGSGIQREIQWLPYDDLKGGDRSARMGAFLDDERVITSSGNGKIAIWKIDGAEPLCWLQAHHGCIPTLSPDRKYLFFSTGKDIAAFDVAAEEVAASFPTPQSQFSVLAFSPDGKRLACAAFDRLYIWNVDKGTLYREISLTGSQVYIGEHVLWTDDNNVLLGNRLLVDLGLQIPIWDYQGIDAIARSGDTCWIGPFDPTKPGVLIPSRIPHAAVKDAINKALMDPNFFVLRSGTTVKIDVSGIQDANERNRVAQSLTKKLAAIGAKVGPAGTIDLVASAEMGEVKDVTYMHVGTYPFQHYLSRVKFVFQGQTAWELSGTNVPGFIRISDKESPSAVLKKHEKPNYAWFDLVELPRLLTRPDNAKQQQGPKTIGMTRVSSAGLK